MVKWWESIQVGAKEAAAKQKAWESFLKCFPKANKSRFITQVDVDAKQNTTAEVIFKASKTYYTASSVRTDNIGAWK